MAANIYLFNNSPLDLNIICRIKANTAYCRRYKNGVIHVFVDALGLIHTAAFSTLS